MTEKLTLKMNLVSEDGLCCCEYINENGELSHMLATLCNCEAIDSTFERLCRWQGVDQAHIHWIQTTVIDRCRIPWRGGARKVPLDVTLAITCNVTLLMLGAMSRVAAIVTHILLLPIVFLSIHRIIRGSQAKSFGGGTFEQSCGKKVNDASLTQTPDPVTPSWFYMAWLGSAFVLLLSVYNITVIPMLKINPYENLLFVTFSGMAGTSLYLAKVCACAGFSPKMADDDATELIESGTSWRHCDECQRRVPSRASHCFTCHQCYLQRDHHCPWLNTCISRSNDRVFVCSLFLGLIALCYGTHLSLTSVCHPKLFAFPFSFTVMYPADCSDAFSDWQSGLATSASVYAAVLAVCVAVLWLQQTVCIMVGVRQREYWSSRYRSTRPPGKAGRCSPKVGFANCVQFWWRGSD